MERQTLAEVLEQALINIRIAREQCPELYTGMESVIDRTEQQLRELVRCLNPQTPKDIVDSEHLLN